MPRTAIYLDNHATTRCDPRVVEVMVPLLSEHYGNAASPHALGWYAEEAVTVAREHVATLVGAIPREIMFTSGATEANNLALQGVIAAYASKGRHVISQPTEHAAVRDILRHFERQGRIEVTWLPVALSGRIDPADVAAALRPDTILVSLMLANNEIGTVQPLAAVGALCKAAGVLLHTDAAQAVGKIPVDVHALDVDLLSLSAHKFYGPKGVGALYVRRRRPRVKLEPLLFGGGQERSLRPGTLPVHQLAGLGRAAELAHAEIHSEVPRILALRERLRLGLEATVPGLRVNGTLAQRLPGNLNVSVPGVPGDALLSALRPLALSTGSACSSGTRAPSHVLRGIGLSDALAHASLRFGLGRFTTEAHIDAVLGQVGPKVATLRTELTRYDAPNHSASEVTAP
jgi:cysteine desulfurase